MLKFLFTLIITIINTSLLGYKYNYIFTTLLRGSYIIKLIKNLTRVVSIYKR